MSSRLNQEREKELEPKRMDAAKAALLNRLITYTCPTDKSIQFIYNGEIVTFYPYSGWHTGKSIKDGRGLANLLKQLI